MGREGVSRPHITREEESGVVGFTNDSKENIHSMNVYVEEKGVIWIGNCQHRKGEFEWMCV